MKTIKYFVLCSLLAFIFTACRDEFKPTLSFAATVDKSTALLINDTIFVKKDSLINFNFTGNPSNIVFYSGETGEDYKSKDLTQLPISQIDSCYLKFDAMASGTNAVVANTLSLRISNNYNGLIASTLTPNYLKDSLDVRDVVNYGWSDSTTACGFPISTNVLKSVKLNMMNYLGKGTCLQFRYLTNQNTQVQPGWSIANLKFVIYQHGQLPQEVLASRLNFKWIDVLYSNHYSSSNTSGTGCWNKTNPALITMSASSIGKPLNEDYLINDPFIINGVAPSVGVAVKNMTNNLASYSYKYSKTGVYTVTFVATNQNYIDNGQQKLVNLIIKVQ